MKKLILEVVVLLSLLIITINQLYKLNITPRLKSLDEKKGKIEIINFGTSHGGDFYYGNFQGTSMFFNYAGNTLFYDMQNFRYLEENGYLAENAIIILPVSYFAFGLDENRTDGLVGEAFANQFYEYLPPWYIHNYSLKNDFELRIHKVQKNFRSLFRLKDIRAKKQETPKKQNQVQSKKPAEKAPQISKTEKKIRELNYHAVNRVKEHKRLGEYSSEEKNIRYLETIIRKAKAGNYRLVLVTTPYYYVYNDNFEDGWLEKKYFSHMRRIAAKHDIPYLDYSHHEALTKDPTYYQNSDHLNDVGRYYFNQIFFRDLEEVTGN